MEKSARIYQNYPVYIFVDVVDEAMGLLITTSLKAHVVFNPHASALFAKIFFLNTTFVSQIFCVHSCRLNSCNDNITSLYKEFSCSILSSDVKSGYKKFKDHKSLSSVTAKAVCQSFMLVYIN